MTTRPVTMRRWRLVDLAFFGGLSLMTLAILTQTLDDLVPGGLARRISINSEGYVIALGLGAWLRFSGRAFRAAATLSAAASCAAVGSALVLTDLPSRFRTLNEAFFAIALGLVYLIVPRPIRPVLLLVPLVLATAVLASIVSGNEEWAVGQAELIGVAVLLPLALDVVDRGILSARAVTSTTVRWSWLAVLVGEVVVTSLLGTDRRQQSGVVAGILEYLGRIHEAVIAVVLIQICFAIGYGRSGRAGTFAELADDIFRRRDPIPTGDAL